MLTPDSLKAKRNADKEKGRRGDGARGRHEAATARAGNAAATVTPSSLRLSPHHLFASSPGRPVAPRPSPYRFLPFEARVVRFRE